MAARTPKTDVDETAGEPAITSESVAQAMARFIQRDDDGPIRQVSVHKAKYRTPWHPSGDPNRPKLTRKMRLNGVQLRDRMLSNKEIDLLNQVKPGKYHNKRWFVMETDGDEDGSKVDIFLPNKTQQDRLALAGDARNLEEVLTIIVNEAK